MAATDTRRKPRCPNCGSEEVREWALQPVAVQVAWIDSEGELQIDFDTDSETADDSQFDELMCRACDYASKDPLDFYPKS